MTLPAPITYGQVRWRVLSAVPDTADVDALPDVLPVTGFVTFTPSAPKLLAGGVSPATILPVPLRYDLDVAGVLRDAQGRDLITLPATDAPDVSPTGWTWRVDGRFGTLPLQSFSFALPTGAVVDLTTVAPLPASMRQCPVRRCPVRPRMACQRSTAWAGEAGLPRAVPSRSSSESHPRTSAPPASGTTARALRSASTATAAVASPRSTSSSGTPLTCTSGSIWRAVMLILPSSPASWR